MKIITKTSLIGCLLLSTGCLSTIDSRKLEYPPSVANDEAYDRVYKEFSASYDLIYHFETKFKINITHLSQKFREAVAVRHEKIFREADPVLNDASQKMGFFISLYSSNRNLEELSDDQLWTIQLKVAGKTLKPSLIKNLTPKDRWQVFFPAISLWSREYLVLFDQAPLVNQPDSIESSAELVLASPEGTVSSRW